MVGGLPCVVSSGKVVPVRAKGDQILEIVLARGLEDAGNERLLARLRRQSDELDGTNKVPACWIGLADDDLGQLELSLEAQCVARDSADDRPSLSVDCGGGPVGMRGGGAGIAAR